MTGQGKIGDGDEAWRLSVIGASEIAALMGLSPWKTLFQLWHEKKGTYPPEEFATTEFQQAGVWLEPAIIKWACDKWAYEPFTHQPKRLTWNKSGERIGGHPDCLAIDLKGGAKSVILEIKTVDASAYRNWPEGEPPIQYQLQAMAYAAMQGCQEAHIIVLIGGNRLERWVVPVIGKTWRHICKLAREFWQSIDEGREPAPDYERDGDAIAQAYGHLDISLVDLTGNPQAAELAKLILASGELERANAKAKSKFQAELNHLIGIEGKGSDEEVAKVAVKIDGYTASSVRIAGTPDRPAEPGEIIKGRKSYRRLYLRPIEAKEEQHG